MSTSLVSGQVVSLDWIGTTADALVNSNWSGNTVPTGSGNENIVIGASTVGNTLTIPTSLAVNGLVFNSGRPSAFVITGTSSPILTLAGNISVAGSGDIALASSVAVSLTPNAHSIDIAELGTTVSIGANVGESGGGASVTKLGNGQLQLSGTNSFSGDLTADAGIVQLVSSGARASGTWTFNNASRLNADATNALSAGVETTFNNTSRLNATQASAVSGGTQTFNSSSNLYASTGTAVSGGTQTFYDNSYLVAEVGSAVSGGTLKFYDSSAIYPQATNSITGVTISFYENSYMIISAADALSTTTNLYFNGSLGGTSGSVSLRGNNTNVGYIASGVAGTGGVITNDSTTAATLTTNFTGTHSFFGSIGNGSVEAGTAGALSLTKSGTGTLVLAGTNSFTGATTVSGGRLELDSDTALSSTTAVSLTNSGSVLDATHHSITIGTLAGDSGTTVELESAGKLMTAGNGSTTFAGTFNGPSGSEFKKGGTGTLTLTGTGSMLGTAVVDAGTLKIGTSGTFNSGIDITLNNSGVLDVSENQHVRRLSSTSTSAKVSIASDKELKVDLPQEIINDVPVLMTSTYAGVLDGSGSLLKWGPGWLTLGGASSTFNGLITVGSGILEITNAGALGTTTGGTYVQAPGTLKLNEVSNVAEPLVFQGNNSVASLIGVDGASLTGTITMEFSSIIDVPGAADTLRLDGVIGESESPGQALTKIGDGTLILGAANTYTGNTNIDDGVLMLDHNSALQHSTFNHDDSDGTLSFGSLTTATLGGLSGNQPLSLTNQSDPADAVAMTVGNNNAHTTYSGVLSGNGSLIKSGNGSLTLSGSNTFAGLTTINSGNLIVAHAAGLGSDVSETRVNTGATLTLQNAAIATEAIKLNGGGLAVTGTSSVGGPVTLTGSGSVMTTTSSDALTISGAIGESAAGATLAKSGLGTLTLGGANTFTGALNVNAGTLVITHSGAMGTTAGATAVNAGAKLKLSGTHVGAEPVTLAGGALAASGASSLSGDVTLSGFAEVNVDAGGSLTLSGEIGESGGTRNLTKTGTGSLVINGVENSYTGFTSVEEGELHVGATNALPVTTKLGIGSGASVYIDENQTIAGFLGSFVGEVSDLIIDAEKSLTIDPAIDNGSGGFYDGNISGGTLIIDGMDATTETNSTFVGLGGTNTPANTIVNGGVLQIGIGATGTLASNITNHGDVLFYRSATNSYTYNHVISGTGGVSFIGGGAFTLGAAQTHTGGTYLSSATLNLGTTNALPTDGVLSLSSSTLNVLENQTVKALFGIAGSTIDITNGKTFTIAPPVAATESSEHHTYFAGALTGGGSLVVNAPGEQQVVIAGASPSFTGDTTVSQGILVLGHNQALGQSPTAGDVILSGGILATTSNVTVPNTLVLNSGLIAGSGSFGSAVIGAGVTVSPELVLLSGSRADHYEGVTTVLGFTNLTLASGGTFEVDFDYESQVATGFEEGVFLNVDSINVSGTLTLDAGLSTTPFTFKLVAPESFSLSETTSWTLISAGSLAIGGDGVFATSKFTLDTSDFGQNFGGAFSLSLSGTNVMLNFTPVPEPSTLAMMVAGAGAVAIFALRHRRRV